MFESGVFAPDVTHAPNIQPMVRHFSIVFLGPVDLGCDRGISLPAPSIHKPCQQQARDNVVFGEFKLAMRNSLQQQVWDILQF